MHSRRGKVALWFHKIALVAVSILVLCACAEKTIRQEIAFSSIDGRLTAPKGFKPQLVNANTFLTEPYSELIAKAFETNSNVKVAALNSESAVRLSKGEVPAVVSLNAQYSKTSGNSIATVSNENISINLQGAKNDFEVQQGDLECQIAFFELEIARNELALNLLVSLSEYRYLLNALQIQKQVESIAQDILSNSKVQFENGRITSQSLSEVQIDILTQRSNRLQFQSELENVERQIRSLMSVTSLRQFRVLDDAIETTDYPDFPTLPNSFSQIPTKPSNRIEALKYDLQLARVGAFQRELMPKIGIDGLLLSGGAFVSNASFFVPLVSSSEQKGSFERAELAAKVQFQIWRNTIVDEVNSLENIRQNTARKLENLRLQERELANFKDILSSENTLIERQISDQSLQLKAMLQVLLSRQRLELAKKEYAVSNLYLFDAYGTVFSNRPANPCM